MWQATDSSTWTGRTDSEDGEAGHRWHQVIDKPRATPPGTCLIGFASDLGVRLNKGRPGAAEGPISLRRSLAGLAAHHDHPLYDDGTVKTEHDLPASQAEYARRVADRLEEGHFVMGLGGGHELGWASYLGLRHWLGKHDPQARVGILNFDAHFDLRTPNPDATSGTPFKQAADWCTEHKHAFDYACIGISDTANTQALFETAHALDVRYLKDVDCLDVHANPFIRRFIGELDYLYVTVCLDVLPGAIAPGVSAPATLGIQPSFLMHCLKEIQRCCLYAHCQWVIGDIAELNPSRDVDDQTARMAARIAWEMDYLQRKDRVSA